MLSDPVATAGGRGSVGNNVGRDPMTVRAVLTRDIALLILIKHYDTGYLSRLLL